MTMLQRIQLALFATAAAGVIVLSMVWAPHCAPWDHSGARIGGVIMIVGCR